MDEAMKVEIQAMIDTSIAAAVAALPPNPFEPSKYVTVDELSRAMADVHSAPVATGTLDDTAETKRTGIWLMRVLSKFHSAERPSDMDIGVVRDDKTGMVTSVNSAD